MFGISAPEFVVLLAVAAVVLGPERLPQYAQSLARLVRELRRMAQGASEQVRAELGPEFEDVDWRRLDPRQYDPRRIVREALADTIDFDDPLGLRDKPVSSGGPQAQPLSSNGSAGGGSVGGGSGSNGATLYDGGTGGIDPARPAAARPPRQAPTPGQIPIDPDAT